VNSDGLPASDGGAVATVTALGVIYPAAAPSSAAATATCSSLDWTVYSEVNLSTQTELLTPWDSRQTTAPTARRRAISPGPPAALRSPARSSPIHGKEPSTGPTRGIAYHPNHNVLVNALLPGGQGKPHPEQRRLRVDDRPASRGHPGHLRRRIEGQPAL